MRSLHADGLLTNVRGDGAVWGVSVPDHLDAVEVRNTLLDEGVIVRPLPPHLLMCPPLVITDQQVDRLVEAMGKVLSS